MKNTVNLEEFVTSVEEQEKREQMIEEAQFESEEQYEKVEKIYSLRERAQRQKGNMKYYGGLAAAWAALTGYQIYNTRNMDKATIVYVVLGLFAVNSILNLVGVFISKKRKTQAETDAHNLEEQVLSLSIKNREV